MEKIIKNIIIGLLLTSYSILIFFNANLQVIDDHGILNNLMIGRFFDGYLSQALFSIGRFYPLNMQEFNLVNLFFTTPDVKFFYALISIEFLILMFVFFRIFQTLGFNKYFFISMIMLVLLPAFITGIFRLHIGERSVLFFFTIFLFSFLKFQKEQKWLYALVGLISANIALYYKEPAFLMLGSFAFFHLVFGWKELNFKQKILDLLLMISALVFITVYFFIVYLHKSDNLYATTTINPILVFAKNIFNYGLNDPLLIFILTPLVIWRIYIIIITRKAHPLFDAMLFASSIYILIFLKLNMFSQHYLLPSYAFAIPAIVYYVTKEQIYKKIVFKFLGTLTIITIIFSSLPIGLHLISHYKNVPNNFQKTLSFLTEYIEVESKNGHRTSIFLDGVNKNGGEVHHSFIKYLEFRGLKSGQFDIKSDEADNGVIEIASPKIDSLYTIWNQTSASDIASGDLVIVTPYTTKYISLDKKEISEMQSDYELLYHASSFAEVPNIGIKPVLKYIAMNTQNNLKDNKVMMSNNIFEMPLDFYVFKKR